MGPYAGMILIKLEANIFATVLGDYLLIVIATHDYSLAILYSLTEYIFSWLKQNYCKI